MKTFIGVIIFLALQVFTQTGPDLVRQQAELNSLRADLEEARRVRDQAVVARWADKQKFNEERESLVQTFQESREKLDQLLSERSRQMEELRLAREDLEHAKVSQEKARGEFLGLVQQQDRVESFMRAVENAPPLQTTQRIQIWNKVRREMEVLRDDPLRMTRSLLEAAHQEILYSREIEWSKGEEIFGGVVAQGMRVRLGSVGAVKALSDGSQSALLLPQAAERTKSWAWQYTLPMEVSRQISEALLSDSTIILLPIDAQLSTSLSTQISANLQKGYGERLQQFFADGGLLMYPLAGIFLLALFLSLERIVVLFWRGRYHRKKLEAVVNLCLQGNKEDAMVKANAIPGTVGKVVRTALQNNGEGRIGAERALEEVFAKEVPAIEARLSTISVLGGAAPLLGLLGTVVGMIELFQVITLHGTSDPKLLAGGISIALVTTQAGLMAAIPIQLMHNFLVNYADRIVGRMEHSGLRILNTLWSRG